jgi:PBP1b-binding outer membrane lipoprotein LpoB
MIIFLALVFTGCANNQKSASSASTNPSQETYGSNDLQKTGKRTAGEALQAADPSVTASGGH